MGKNRNAARLLLEEKLAFAKNEQITDVVQAGQQPFKFLLSLCDTTSSVSLLG